MKQTAQTQRHPLTRRPLVQIVLSRLREFYREPEAVFWVYGFPLLMVVALGIAFRNQPERPIVVDVVDGAGAEAAEAGLAKNERFQVRRDALEACRVRLRLGKTDLVVITDEGASPRYDYWFDPGRPESALSAKRRR